MEIGAFTGQFDLPLLLVQLFFLFFLGLVFHLRREDKREGYPLVSHRTARTGGRIKVVGFPAMPEPKAFLLPHGRGTVYAPRREELPPIEATNVGNLTGMPIEPIGNPLLSRTGAAAWTPKLDEPDLSWEGDPVFVPLRAAPGFHVMKGDSDPTGFVVLGRDKVAVGRVVDVWLDKGEHHARFIEVALDAAVAAERLAGAVARIEKGGEAPTRAPLSARVGQALSAAGHTLAQAIGLERRDDADDSDRRQEPGEPPLAAEQRQEAAWHARAAVPAPPGHVLLPIEFASVDGRRRTVRSAAITAAQFADIPGRSADTILTAREEQRIRGYFGGGLLWGTPSRFGPLL